jgi:hypothetical protein
VLKLESKGLKIGKTKLEPPPKKPRHKIFNVKIEIEGSLVKKKLRNIV